MFQCNMFNINTKATERERNSFWIKLATHTVANHEQPINLKFCSLNADLSIFE